MKNWSIKISTISLVISSITCVFAYQQYQHIEKLQQRLLELSKLGLRHAEETRKLQELVLTVAKEASLEVQLDRMVESTKEKIQQSSKKMLESTMDSLEKIYNLNEQSTEETIPPHSTQ